MRAESTTRLLMVDDLVPDPRLGYGYSRSRAAIEALVAQGAHVTFFPRRDAALSEPATGELRSLGVEVVDRRRRWRRKPLSLRAYLARQGHRFPVLWVSRPSNLQSVLRAVARTRRPRVLVYDAEAIVALREARRLRLLGTPWSLDEERRRLEREIDDIRQADLVLTVSSEEEELLAKRGISRRYRLVCSMPVDPTPRSYEQRNGVLFVGSFLNLHKPSPNLDAAAFLAKEVLPRLGAMRRPHLTIAGFNSEALRAPPHAIAPAPEMAEWIEITGTREDLTELYDCARVFVAPTRFGSGVSLKVHEAMSRGIPCVVSRLIARQMESSEGAFLVADGADELAAAISRCHEDRALWHALRDGGVRYVAAHASPAAFAGTLGALLGELAARGAGGVGGVRPGATTAGLSHASGPRAALG